MNSEAAGQAVDVAGREPISTPAHAVHRTPGTDPRDLLLRLRDDIDAELARVRETIRVWEADRIGIAGSIALLIAIGFNVWGYVVYENRYMLLWIVASLYFFGFYWLVPMVAGTAQGMLRRKKPCRRSDLRRPNPIPGS